MRTRLRYPILIVTAALAAGLGAMPAVTAGGQRAAPFHVTAAMSKCRGQSVTVGMDIEPAQSSAVRRVAGASLRVRFEAAPLFGRLRRSREFDLGRTTRARRFHRFSGLRAQSYSGIVRYRWVRGKRTVLSGMVRTRRARVAGRRGTAFCTLRVGRRPVDRRPPTITPIPGDGTRQSGGSPIDVRFFVFDDLSGVALVVSRVDGGPFVRGREVRIEGVGEHRLEYVARDAAGNQSKLAAATLYIDP